MKDITLLIKKLFHKKKEEEPVNKNPYILLWYKHNWSHRKVEINNSKYWQWEIDNNGFKP